MPVSSRENGIARFLGPRRQIASRPIMAAKSMSNDGVQVTLIFSRQTGVNQLPLTFRMVEFVTPRNN